MMILEILSLQWVHDSHKSYVDNVCIIMGIMQLML